MNPHLETRLPDRRRLGRDLPRGHAAVGRRQAPRRVEPRAGRVPPPPANGAGGRLRHAAPTRSCWPAAASRSRRSIARRSPSSGPGCGRSSTTPCSASCWTTSSISPLPPASSTSSTTPACITPSARRVWNGISTCCGASLVPAPIICAWPARRTSRPRRGRRRSPKTKSTASWAGSSSSSTCGRRRLEGANPNERRPGWSCLMRRPPVAGK